jgi:hypothetical protein
MAITSTQLTGSAAPFYTSSGASAVTAVYFCNTDASNTAIVTVHALSSGDTVSDVNMIYNEISLTAGDTYVIDTEKIIFDSGDTLQAFKTGNANVSATVSYVGI